MGTQVFQILEKPTISGFLPTFGQEGDSFIVSGDWLRDVDEINFIDSLKSTQIYKSI